MDHGSKARRHHPKGPAAREARHPAPAPRSGAWILLLGIALFGGLIVLFMQ